MKKEWKTKAERAAWIFYQLRLRETSAAALGRKMQPPQSKRVMSYVINDQDIGLAAARVRRVRQVVAAAVGLEYEALWGEGDKGSQAGMPAPPPSPLTISPARGEGEDKEHRLEACATRRAR